MSGQGQKRRFGDVRATSALPLKADIDRKGRHVSRVPGAVFGRSGFSSASACLKTLSISD